MLVLSRDAVESPRGRRQPHLTEVVVEHAGETLRLQLVIASRGHARIAFNGPRSFTISRGDAAQPVPIDDVPTTDRPTTGVPGAHSQSDALCTR